MGIFKKFIGGKKPPSGKKGEESRPGLKAPKAKTSPGKEKKAASADVGETPMGPEDIIREAMRIRKRKLVDAAAREEEAEFAKEVESFIEPGAKGGATDENEGDGEDESVQSIKMKNEAIVREALKLRKQCMAEEKQAADKAAAAKKKASSAKKKAPEPEPEKPESREELIRKAMQIREEKQELLSDIDSELREKLSQAVMAKFDKINKGEW